MIQIQRGISSCGLPDSNGQGNKFMNIADHGNMEAGGLLTVAVEADMHHG